MRLLFTLALLAWLAPAFAKHQSLHHQRSKPGWDEETSSAVQSTTTSFNFQDCALTGRNVESAHSSDASATPGPLRSDIPHTGSCLKWEPLVRRYTFPAPHPSSTPATSTLSGIFESSSTPSLGSASGVAGSSVQPTSGANGTPTESGLGSVVGAGICYDTMGLAQCKDLETIQTEFALLKSQGYTRVRIYGVGCPVGDFIKAAAQAGLRLMAGIDSIANLQADLQKLISMVGGDWGAIDTVYVGNELVHFGQASSGQVAGAVSSARGLLGGAGFSGSVVAADTFDALLDPVLCSTSDFCAANVHAFYDPNTAAEDAGAFVADALQRVAAANAGKKVVITESGWPWKGSCNGRACPSVENQMAALNSISRSFSGRPDALFLFQAYNALYKQQPGEFGEQQFFGIYDSGSESGR